jgi:hypothetical protein
MSFLFRVKIYSIVGMYYSLFFHASNNGHLDCFHLMAVVNNAVTNTGMQVSLVDPTFSYFGYIYQSVGLLDHMIVYS